MRRFRPAAVAALTLGTLLTACSDPTGTPDPARSPSPTASLEAGRVDPTRTILVLDRCDPKSFNAAIGAGTCERHGERGVPFPTFLDQIRSFHRAADWRFDPTATTIALGTTLLAVNHGGEVHTFTEVREFGGGIVPLLNDLSDNRHVAPECLALEDDDFIPPGGTYPDKPDEAGVEKYQCCIHPWMRTVVTISQRK